VQHNVSLEASGEDDLRDDPGEAVVRPEDVIFSGVAAAQAAEATTSVCCVFLLLKLQAPTVHCTVYTYHEDSIKIE
jgi:hypothetical protein